MHTPGPWNLGSSDIPVTGLSIHSNLDRKHSTLARVVQSDKFCVGADEAYSNAKLMAAAPELLSALKDLCEAVEVAIKAGDWKVDGACDPESSLCRAKSSIYKATGEYNERV